MTAPVVRPFVSVRRADFDAGAEIAAACRGRTDVGGVASFIGLCRDEGQTLQALELEHYPGMAEAEIGRIAHQAAARWPLLALTVIHRFGRIRPGENIVLVVAASAHRQAVFDAASFLMDFLKTRAPFWKKEFFREGAGGWVAAREADDDAAGRWT